MFKKKEIEQELERANKANAQLEQYKQVLDSMEEYSENARVELDQIGMSATRMDKSLTKVVDYSKDSVNVEQQSSEALAEMTSTLLDISGQNTTLYGAYHTLGEEYRAQKDALLNLMEQSKHYTNITKNLAESTNDYQEHATAMLDETAKMTEYGKSMGVLALNSAIEAGRLGDSGTEYIKAAEEVRDYAERYDASARQMEEEITGLQESIQGTSEQIHQLIVLLKENNVLLSKLAGMSSDQCAKMEQEQIRSSQEQVKELNQQILILQKNSQTVTNAQQLILGEMESIGTCYMEEQDSTKKMETTFDGMKQLLSDLDHIEEP